MLQGCKKCHSSYIEISWNFVGNFMQTYHVKKSSLALSSIETVETVRVKLATCIRWNL